jgi:hypothetical protein
MAWPGKGFTHEYTLLFKISQWDYDGVKMRLLYSFLIEQLVLLFASGGSFSWRIPMDITQKYIVIIQ